MKRDQLTALESYSLASESADIARRPADLGAVSRAIGEGRYAVASARARLDGREPPDRRPPCFFDPRHGPSATDVEWSPDGGAGRAIPACAADATRISDGEHPTGREVIVDGERRSYWDAPGYYSARHSASRSSYLNGVPLDRTVVQVEPVDVDAGAHHSPRWAAALSWNSRPSRM